MDSQLTCWLLFGQLLERVRPDFIKNAVVLDEGADVALSGMIESAQITGWISLLLLLSLLLLVLKSEGA